MQSTVTSQMTAMTATMGAQAGALRAEMNTGAAELRASIAEDSYGTRALDFLQPATTRMLKLQGACVVRGLARLTARAPCGHTGRFWHGAGVTPWPPGRLGAENGCRSPFRTHSPPDSDSPQFMWCGQCTCRVEQTCTV